jgi:hypothetical protein
MILFGLLALIVWGISESFSRARFAFALAS